MAAQREVIINVMVGYLAGVRVLVTRPADHNQETLAALEAAGARAIPYPTVAVAPVASFAALEAALARIDRYAWVIFTSATAVRFTAERPGAKAALARASIAAVGAGTARALTERGLVPALVPDDHRQEGLLAALGNLPPDSRVLFPQAAQGREFLRDELSRRGTLVEVVPVSETRAVAPLAPLPPFDAAFFASPSALRAFVDAHGRTPLATAIVIAIGPTTASAAADAGVQVDAVAATPSAEGLVQALATCYKLRH